MTEKLRLYQSILFTSSYLCLIWIIKIAEYTFSLNLSYLGIFPRTFEGSLGIFTSPLIHGDFYHLISNSFPIALLGVSLWYFYREVALKVIAIIYFFSGFWVWIVARSAFHLGASGIVYGLIFFHLSVGLLRMDRKTLSISLLVIFLYGSSILSGLLPLSEGVSFETHITGAISGLISAVLFRKNYFFVLDNQKEKEIHREECSINELYNRSDTADSETNITVKYISNPSEKEK